MAVFYYAEKGENINVHELGLSEKQLKLCTDEGLTSKEIELVAKCLADGIPYKRLRKYIKRKFSGSWCYYVDEDDDTIYYSIIEYIVKGLELGFNDEQIALYTTSRLKWWQIEVVIKGIQEGFTPEQIQTYAKKDCTYNEVQELYNKMKNEK